MVKILKATVVEAVRDHPLFLQGVLALEIRLQNTG